MYKPAKPVKNIIIGAGPAGIQLGYFFQKAGIEYVILEKAEKAGSFFDKYPHSGKLISINKKHTGSDIEDFNLRHDWNSLLSEDGPKFTDYSDDFYPDSKDLTRYLNDFANKFKLNIKYNTTVEKIRQKDNGYVVAVSDSEGKWLYACEKLIVATGMGTPDMSDIEDTTETIKHYADYEKDYFKDPDNLTELNGKTILLIGNGNSSYELANLLTPHCGSILILGRSEKEWAMFSHYAGDLRSTYLGFHDTFLLKSLNAFDGQSRKLKIISTNGKYTPTYECMNAHCGKEHTYIGTPHGGFDSVILCTGWKFDYSIFDFELDMIGKYPMVDGKFESSSYKNLFFIGSLMHSKDYKQSSGGFIHGFRYLIEYFFHINYDGKIKVNKFKSDSLETLAKHMVYKINLTSPMYQMFGYIMDLIVYNPAKNDFTYINDVHREFLSTKAPDETLIYFTLSLEYTNIQSKWLRDRDIVRDINMLGVKISRLGSECKSTLIHPVLRVFKDKPNKVMIDEIHFDEELYARFIAKDDYLNKFIRSLKMFI